MKKKIAAVIHSLGGYTAYSGKTKIMYINPLYNKQAIVAALAIITINSELPFKLVIE